MKNTNELAKSLSGICLLAVFVITSLTTANAQESLRDAIDLDGDNKADRIVVRPDSNTWYTLKSNGSGLAARAFGSAVNDIPTPGDFDGDGTGDFGVWRASDGTFYYFLTATGTFGSKAWGIAGDEPVARRWDNDPITDFAVARRANNQIVWYINRSTDNSLQAQVFGSTNDIPIPGDYDGDGRFDVAVKRATSLTTQSTVYMDRTTAGFAAINWGLGGDFTVAGDYDGDGKTDLTAVRAESGNLVWYILQSSNSAVLVKSFGSAQDDYLVSNDYDGDGKTDVAVWRRTNGVFYVENSGGGTSSLLWGLPSDFPVAAYDTH